MHKNIKFQNPEKEIVFINGSPFENDDNSEYKSIKLREIQENLNKDRLIIIYNLNQIHPFLYDLYNKNYIIKDEEKYVRIYFDSFTEQLIPINDPLRIIILVDTNCTKEIDYTLFNRFEKVKIKFWKLLDDKQKTLAKKILEDINFKRYIEDTKINYNLMDLLINCDKEEIQGLVYYETIKNNHELNENKIKDVIFSKIIKFLSQDIISILPEGHKIKELYLNEKRYYNLKSYINELNEKNYKISIIYTFNNISSISEGINNKIKFSISEIKKENQLEKKIKELTYEYEKLIRDNNDNNSKLSKYLYIYFDQFDSNKIQFVSEYIKKKFKSDDYKYIFMVHIHRNFDSQINSTIYSIPDIDPDIDQLFIDNLNGPNLKFKDLLKSNIKFILDDNSEYMDLDNEFNKLLSNFVFEGLNKKRNKSNNNNLDKSMIIKDNNYSKEIIKYMKNNSYFKEKIILKAKNFLNEENNVEENGQKLIERILYKKYIDKSSLDIISCTLNYIKVEIFCKYINYILAALEDNNILTTLIEIQNNNENNKIDESKINQFLINFLDNLTYDEKKEFNPKFLYNYKIPGFYNYLEENYSQDKGSKALGNGDENNEDFNLTKNNNNS